MYFSIMEEKMDNQKLAELLFPDVTKTPEYYEEKYPYRKLPNKAEVTRLAPSPTGFIHLGNLYSALTDERLAHRNGGKFYLRIEDTDAKRTVEGAVDTVINVLRYFNIEFDEESINYYRFITHLKFFTQRLSSGRYYEDNDNDLFDMIKLKYPNSYECVKRIEGFIKQKYCTQLTKEEMLYLIIHTARVVHENC